MLHDRLRSLKAIKILFEPLELNVVVRWLKRAGGVVPLGGGASDISLALIQVALKLALSPNFP